MIVGRLARSADLANVTDPALAVTQVGNGRVNMEHALADTGTEEIQPAGVEGGGGPIVGPYQVAASTFESVSVGTQSGTLTSGTSGTATYTVTVTRSGSGILDVLLSLTTSLPTGATASFNPGTVSFNGNTPTSKTSTLTISTSTSTPAGTTTFNSLLWGQSTQGQVTTTKSANGTLMVGKANATVTLSNLTQTYTGSPLTPSATTNPAGLTIVWDGAPQTNAGSYSVTGTIDDLNYQGLASGTFVIAKANATIVSDALQRDLRRQRAHRHRHGHGRGRRDLSGP